MESDEEVLEDENSGKGAEHVAYRCEETRKDDLGWNGPNPKKHCDDQLEEDHDEKERGCLCDQETKLGNARESKCEERHGEEHPKLGTPMGYKAEDFSHCELDHGGDSV